MKIGKYAFKDKATADSKIKSLPKKHSHSIVKLGKIVKSKKYHIEVRGLRCLADKIEALQFFFIVKWNRLLESIKL